MNTKNILAALTSMLILSTIMASGADAQSSRQSDKNNMRNIGIAAGAGAVYEALHGKTTNAVILGAGAAYAGKKYEDQRKAENKQNHSHHRYTHHRTHHK